MAGRFFSVPFAFSGDRTVTPLPTQLDGSVSYTQGFTFDYERPNTDPDYKPVPRDGMNGLLFDITEAVGIIQRQGFADWTADAAPYAINSVVRHNNVVWRSTITNNSDTPGATSAWVDTAQPTHGFASFITVGVTNWPVPDFMQSGAVKPKVKVISGGGGGGRSSTSGQGSGGGGGGGVSEGIVDLTGVTSVSITVGAGGIGAIAPGQGGSGGSSSFGAFMSATGGEGGLTTNGGSSGMGNDGTLNIGLGCGGSGSGAEGGGGGGPGQRANQNAGDGNPALRTGGGGSGARFGGNGGNGFRGQVIVEW